MLYHVRSYLNLTFGELKESIASTSLISDDGSNQGMVKVAERALIAIAKPVNGPPQ